MLTNWNFNKNLKKKKNTSLCPQRLWPGQKYFCSVVYFSQLLAINKLSFLMCVCVGGIGVCMQIHELTHFYEFVKGEGNKE